MKKPKFRLHVHGDEECCHWTCSVSFNVGHIQPKMLHSGPCTQPRTAIAEATMLMRRATGHNYR